jgi:hypothetical protein
MHGQPHIRFFKTFKELMGIAFSFTLDAGLMARSQYWEGPATGHLDTGFSWFPCAYTEMLRWFPRFQVATTCFSFSPPEFCRTETFIMLTSFKTAPQNRYQPHPAEPEQYTKCSNGFFVLLKMGIMMPETC